MKNESVTFYKSRINTVHDAKRISAMRLKKWLISAHHFRIPNKTLSFRSDRYQRDGKTSSSSPVTSGGPQNITRTSLIPDIQCTSTICHLESLLQNDSSLTIVCPTYRCRLMTNTMACAPSEDSDQLGHPPSLISLCYPHEERLGP